jgi:hypothetical protein
MTWQFINTLSLLLPSSDDVLINLTFDVSLPLSRSFFLEILKSMY